MVVMSIRAQNLPVIEEKIKYMGRKGRAPRPAMLQISGKMVLAVDQRFQSQGRRGGGSWRKLSEDWLFAKLARGLDPRILFATGELHRSLVRINHPNNKLRITGTSIEYGSTLPYANTQMFGDPARNIPARPYIRFTAADRREWANILLRYVTSHWSKGTRAK